MALRPLVSMLAVPLTLLVGTPAPQGSVGETGPTRLLADEPWTPSAWRDLGAAPRREVNRYSDSTSYEAARNDTAFEARRWRYRSDSSEVVAFVFCSHAPGAARPAIVYCRGSYVQQGLAPSFLPLFHRLARAGYFVVAPQYRGSEGGTGRDEMGGADVEDVLEAVRLAVVHPKVDGRTVYLYGESRGGMMVLQAIRDRAPVRAAATVGAFSDLDSLFRSDESAAAMATKIWPDYASHQEEIAFRRSAARWAERIRVPLLVLHGGSDRQVPPGQSSLLSRALTRSGVPHELHIIAGGSHTLGEQAALRDSLVVSWFRAHAP